MTEWQPTRYGGYRRTGVAQRKSTAQMKRRSVSRKHPPVLIRLGERLGLPECPYVIRRLCESWLEDRTTAPGATSTDTARSRGEAG
jgi:hypothetical protein